MFSCYDHSNVSLVFITLICSQFEAQQSSHTSLTIITFTSATVLEGSALIVNFPPLRVLTVSCMVCL